MTAELDRRWAVRGAILLIAAFICPLIVGQSWLFGPTLLANAPPGLRTMSMVPGLVGPPMLIVALRLEGIKRAVTLLIASGVSIILLLTTVEQLTLGQSGGFDQVFTGGAAVLPGPRTLLLFALAMTAAATGLALQSSHPVAGPRIVGLAGAVVVALVLAPLGGRTPIGIVLDGIAWSTAWPIPLALVTSLVFGLLCVAMLFDEELVAYVDPVWLTRVAAGVGVVAVLCVPVGMVVNAAVRFPEMVGTTLTLMVKIYGTWLALHVLVAAGAIGLARHGFGGADGETA